LTNITSGWANWDEFIADAKQLAVVGWRDDPRQLPLYRIDAVPATFYSLIPIWRSINRRRIRVNTPEGWRP
jgi:hypothetical protein